MDYFRVNGLLIIQGQQICEDVLMMLNIDIKWRLRIIFWI